MKSFYCAYCNRIESTETGALPDGWYSLMRTWNDDPRGFVRLGIYCSLDCIHQRMGSLHAIVRKHEEQARREQYKPEAVV